MMGIVDRALSAVGLERKSVAAPIEQRLIDQRAETDVDVSVSGRAALSQATVWSCANFVSGVQSTIPLRVRRRNASGVMEDAPDHPINTLLQLRPNYDQTALDFWDYMILSIELHGNAYAEIRREGARIVSMFPLHPQSVMVRRQGDGRLKYRWVRNGQSREAFDREIFHVRGPGGNPEGGMSALHFGAPTIRSAVHANRAAANVFKNGLHPSVALTLGEFLTPEERQALRDSVQENVGSSNTGRPMIVEGGAKFDTLTINPIDAQLLEFMRFNVEEICRIFSVPPPLIGHAASGAAWPSSFSQQMLLFERFCLRRRVGRIEQASQQQLLSAAEIGAGYRVEYDLTDLMRGDAQSRAAFYEKMIRIGAMTINEARAREGLSAVEGGDVPWVQRQNVPMPVILEQQE